LAGREGGNWDGCARALLDHGMLPGKLEGENSELILIDGSTKRFSNEVHEILLGETVAY
jgi:hypothetical protein